MANGDAEGKAIGAATGTLDWVFAEYRADRRFTKLNPKTRRNHEVGLLVGGHVLKDGRRLGEVRLTVINTAVADAVYERLLVVTETDTDSNTVTRERRTTTSGDKVLKSWIVQHRRRGASRRRLLGSAEVLSAEQARALRRVANGEDPQADKAADPHAKDKLTLRGVVPLAFTIAPGREVRNALTTWHDYVRALIEDAERKTFASDGLVV